MSYAPIPMIPGPVAMHPKILAVMGQEVGTGHIEEDFLGLYTATSRNMATIMGTKHQVVLMTGEGMLGLWAALKSVLKPGDAVVSVGTGVFGDGIGQMAASLGCHVTTVSQPYNSTLCDLAPIEDAIRKTRPVMITAVHCETPSGTLNPLAELGQLKADLGVPLFYVDAVASLGGAEVLTDAWHIDLVLGGSQKCLSAPPSMTMVGVSQTAWDIIEKVDYKGYDALKPFRTIHETSFAPYTPYWHGLAALHTATQIILEEGLEAVFARHNDVATKCRKGLMKLGLDLWTLPEAINSPTVTAAIVPTGVSWNDWNERLKRQGLVCSGSYGPMENKVFRLGHMGVQACPALMQQALEAISNAL